MSIRVIAASSSTVSLSSSLTLPFSNETRSSVNKLSSGLTEESASFEASTKGTSSSIAYGSLLRFVSLKEDFIPIGKKPVSKTSTR